MGQLYLCSKGYFYEKIDGVFSCAFKRLHDGYQLPKSEKVRPATEDEMTQYNFLVRSGDRVPQTGKVEVLDRIPAAHCMEGEEEALPESSIGTLFEPSEKFNMANVVLYPETVERVQAGINFIMRRDDIEAVFSISEIDSSERQILNFFGPPGTGKTLMAQCVARELKKPLLQVNYAQIQSKFVGETPKAISRMFEEAEEHGAILFLDEADSLLSRRGDGEDGSAVAQLLDLEKNHLMQELDKFNGIVITTTNHFHNFDPAMLRRIADSIEFRLPDTGMRAKILGHMFSKMKQHGVNIGKTAVMTEGFSGGDLLKMVKNAIKLTTLTHANREKWYLSDTQIEQAARGIRTENAAHSGVLSTKKPLGLRA